MAYLGDSFNPNMPTFQAAERSCQKYAVGLATRVTPAGAAKVEAQQLKYAQCIRTHGVSDFPDPSANGGFTIPNSVDQNSSFFQAAERACKNFLRGVNRPPGVSDRGGRHRTLFGGEQAPVEHLVRTSRQLNLATAPAFRERSSEHLLDRLARDAELPRDLRLRHAVFDEAADHLAPLRVQFLRQ
jgi:hypothetical protein